MLCDCVFIYKYKKSIHNLEMFLYKIALGIKIIKKEKKKKRAKNLNK